MIFYNSDHLEIGGEIEIQIFLSHGLYNTHLSSEFLQVPLPNSIERDNARIFKRHLIFKCT